MRRREMACRIATFTAFQPSTVRTMIGISSHGCSSKSPIVTPCYVRPWPNDPDYGAYVVQFTPIGRAVKRLIGRLMHGLSAARLLANARSWPYGAIATTTDETPSV